MATPSPETVLAATRIVRALCGDRWTSPPARVLERYPAAPSGHVLLRGRPVVEIHEITHDGAALVVNDDYELWGNTLVLSPLLARRCRSGVVTDVEYTFGQTAAPPVAQVAIAELAKQIELADTDPDHCTIPERVTSITRQGVSWTLLDPQDFLQDGRTGIYRVDLAIRALNPGRAKARSRVFSPEHPPPLRRVITDA